MAPYGPQTGWASFLAFAAPVTRAIPSSSVSLASRASTFFLVDVFNASVLCRGSLSPALASLLPALASPSVTATATSPARPCRERPHLTHRDGI